MLLGVRRRAAARLTPSRGPQQSQQPQHQRPGQRSQRTPGHDTAEPQLSSWGLPVETNSPSRTPPESFVSPSLYELALGPIPPPWTPPSFGARPPTTAGPEALLTRPTDPVNAEGNMQISEKSLEVEEDWALGAEREKQKPVKRQEKAER